jgi:hypothetical protein
MYRDASIPASAATSDMPVRPGLRNSVVARRLAASASRLVACSRVRRRTAQILLADFVRIGKSVQRFFQASKFKRSPMLCASLRASVTSFGTVGEMKLSSWIRPEIGRMDLHWAVGLG